MSGEFYVERQYWARWPRVLIVCKKRGRDEEGNLIAERRRYVPEGGTEGEWKARCRDVLGLERKARADYEQAMVTLQGEFARAEHMKAEVDGLKWAIEERDQLIRDMVLWMRCPMSCADCERNGDEGCEFMSRALEMGIEVR